jgi:hypothetical protein
MFLDGVVMWGLLLSDFFLEIINYTEWERAVMKYVLPANPFLFYC